MKRLEEFVNEKLKVSKNNVTLDIPLGEQGWMCTYVYSIYNEIQQVDNFLKSDIELERLYSIDTEDYIKDRTIVFDRIYQALKRRKICEKIINIILSGCTFEEGIERFQEILQHSAKCEYSQSASNSKRQVIRILDSHNARAMVLSFTKL